MSAYNGMSILVVDDSAEDQFLTKTALAKSCACPVVVAGGVDAAIEILLANPPPAFILLDLQMPLKGGFEFLRWIRGRAEAWSRVPVLVLTTSHDYVEIRRAYDLGANSFLVKPTGFDELRAMLADATAYWLGRNRIA